MWIFTLEIWDETFFKKESSFEHRGCGALNSRFTLVRLTSALAERWSLQRILWVVHANKSTSAPWIVFMPPWTTFQNCHRVLTKKKSPFARRENETPLIFDHCEKLRKLQQILFLRNFLGLLMNNFRHVNLRRLWCF